MTDPSYPEGTPAGDRYPERIGPWEVLRLLGRGAMAGVWLCQDAQGRRAAVKWLDRASPRTVQRFERELRALTRVRHPHVIAVLSQGDWEGRPYGVMEYIDGPDLRVYASKLRQRPAAERYREVTRVGMALCEALSAVHDEGLVHRDVKPTNVLLCRRGRAVLADFGVVKDLEEPSGTAMGVLVGTAGYAAPEQLRGEDVDHRADLYGLGATLYYLLTGERPYAGRDARELERSHRSCPVPHPSAADPQVPPALEAVVMRLLAKAPEDRFPSARAAREALSAEAPAERALPLAGRTRYLDAAAASLERVRQGQGRVLHLRGPKGSGRSWLMELIESMGTRRGVHVTSARDELTLAATLQRLARGEALALLTRLPLSAPAGVAVDVLELEPLSIAELRRSVVSVAPATPEPHRVAERLDRLTGGHPATVLALFEQHVHSGALVLPDPIPPPAPVVDAVEALSWESGELLGTLALLQQPARPRLLEQVTQFPVDEALAELEAAGLVRRQGGLYSPSGELVAAIAQELLPDPVAVHRRAAAALAQEPDQQLRSQAHAAQAGDASPASPPLGALLDEAEGLLSAGDPSGASDRVEQVLALAASTRQRELEPRALRLQGMILLDAGQARRAEARFADAVALARALELPGERRAAHILRAAATLDARPGSSTAAAVAMDRLHRAMNTLEGPDTEGYRVLGHALIAQSQSLLGDLRSARAALEQAQAGLGSLAAPLRARVQQRLAAVALPQDSRPPVPAG